MAAERVIQANASSMAAVARELDSASLSAATIAGQVISGLHLTPGQLSLETEASASTKSAALALDTYARQSAGGSAIIARLQADLSAAFGSVE